VRDASRSCTATRKIAAEAFFLLHGYPLFRGFIEFGDFAREISARLERRQ